MVRHEGVTYGASKGKAPGSKLYYKPVYSGGKWNEFLGVHTLGTLLQVCCGGSHVGPVRVDHDPKTLANIRADMFRLPFASRSFDTVACDPPYELDNPRRVRLQREIVRVARRRVIFKATWVPRAEGWRLNDPVMGVLSHTCANVAIMAVLDRLPHERSLFEKERRR